MDDTITLRRSDGDPSRWPTQPEFECLGLDHSASLKWRTAIAAAVVKHTTGQGVYMSILARSHAHEPTPASHNVMLSDWPAGYNLYYHTRLASEDGIRPQRRDAYLIGQSNRTQLVT